MAQAMFVKSARKDNPVAKKGESYWWWQLWHQPKQYSRTRPTQSQLTNSPFLSEVYRLIEDLPDSMDSSEVSDLTGQLEGMLSELEDNLSNMPEQLQEGSVVQERLDLMQEWIDTLNSIEVDDPEQEEDESDEDYEERLDERHTEIAEEVKNSDPGF